MSNDVKSFESASLVLLSRLEQKKSAIQKEYERSLAAVDKEIEAVTTTLWLLRQAQPEPQLSDTEEQVFSAMASIAMAIKDKSAREALIDLARSNKGVVRIADVKPLLTRAGILKDTKNTWGAIYTTLTRSKEFTKVDNEPGTFRLVGAQEELQLQ